eukprot:PhF_6_TR2302/c0_g1_i1/m.4044/K14548/UTP4, CIRH1A; U3 small nucleolar RNA-associated protein 4
MLSFMRTTVHHPPVGVAALALNPDNTHLAVARVDGSLEVWALTSSSQDTSSPLHLINKTGGHKRITPRGVCWIPSTSSILVASLSGQFLVYDARTLSLRDVVSGSGGGFLSMIPVKVDHTVVGVASEDGCVRLYSTSDFSLLGTGAKHPSSQRCLSVAVCPKYLSLYSGDDAGVVQRYEISKFNSRHVTPSFHTVLKVPLSKKRGEGFLTPMIWALAVVPANTHVVAATSTGDVFVLNGNHGSQIAVFHISKAPLLTITTYGQAGVIVGGVARDIVSLHQSSTGWAVGTRTRRVHSNDVTALIPSPSSTGVITGGTDGDMFVFHDDAQVRTMFVSSVAEMKNKLVKYQASVHPMNQYSIARLSDGNTVLAGVGRDALMIWGFADPTAQSSKMNLLGVVSTKALEQNVRALALSSDASYLAYATDTDVAVLSLEGSTIAMLSISPHNIVTQDSTFRERIAEASALAFVKLETTGWILFTGHSSGAVNAVAIDTGNVDSVCKLGATITRIVVNGSYVAFVDAAGEIALWDCVVWKRVGNQMASTASVDPAHRIVDITFVRDFGGAAKGSSNDVHLATVSADGHVDCYTVPSAECVWTSRNNTIPNYPPTDLGRVHGLSLLRERSLCVFSANAITKFRMGSKYTNTQVLSTHQFYADNAQSSGGAASEGGSDDGYVKVVKVRRVLSAFSVGNGTDDVCLLCRHPAEDLAGMNVYNAKRFAT